MPTQRTVLTTEQRLKMSPQLFQSIEMVELPITELREKIQEELERNPALEVLEDRGTVSLDETSGQREEAEDFEGSGEEESFSGKRPMDADQQQRFLEGALANPETLQQHLLGGLSLENLEGPLREAAELIIQNLDEDGFHTESPDLLLEKFPKGTAEKALAVVRSLDPVGTATKDYQESLLVQTRLLPDAPRGMEEALPYLAELEKGRIGEVARKIGRTREETEAIFRRIRELDPFPGRRFFTGETRFVVPDVRVERRDGEFVIIINNEEIPVLGVDPFFNELSLKSRKGLQGNEKNARLFARERLQEAKFFIQSIRERNNTLFRVSQAIVSFQRSFFINGPKHLSPLTQEDIAQELKLNRSTISRTAKGKYMQTEWGIYELRYFFTNSIRGSGSSGSRFSKAGVKEQIRELIEEGGEKLSDQEIAEKLAYQGIKIARRTVSKYRSELKLGSSFDR